MAGKKKMTFKEFKDILKRGNDSDMIFIYANEDGSPDFEAILNAISSNEKKCAEFSARCGCLTSAKEERRVADYLEGELAKRGYYEDTIL